MTALHHAVRQGYVESTTVLLDAGANVNEKTGDGNSPLLVALINGQFDVAMELINRGANVNFASDSHGVTPLWAAVNALWQPRTRFPQPQEMEQQKATYLDVMKALLDKGADVNARIRVHPWYMVYTDCGNANCGLSNFAGSTAFWRAAYGTDIDAMKLLVKYGADPNIPTLSRGGGRGGFGGGGGRGGGGAAARSLADAAAARGPAARQSLAARGRPVAAVRPMAPSRPISSLSRPVAIAPVFRRCRQAARARSRSTRLRRRVRRRLRGQRASPRAGQLARGGEVSGRGARRGRQRA